MKLEYDLRPKFQSMNEFQQKPLLCKKSPNPTITKSSKAKKLFWEL